MQIYCPVIAGPSQENMAIFFFLFFFSVTHTKDSLIHLRMTHYPRRRCEKCSLIWKLQKWIRSLFKIFRVCAATFLFVFYTNVKKQCYVSTKSDRCSKQGWFSWTYKDGKARFFLASNVSLSSHRPLYNFIEAPLWEGHNSSLLWVESAWQKGDARQFLGIVNYSSRTWCRTARLTSDPYGGAVVYTEAGTCDSFSRRTGC